MQMVSLSPQKLRIAIAILTLFAASCAAVYSADSDEPAPASAQDSVSTEHSHSKHHSTHADGSKREREHDQRALAERPPLKATVTAEAKPDPVREQIDQVILQALDNHEELKVYSARVSKYKRPHQRLIALTRDALNYVMFYRGESASNEARKVILEEQKDSKSDASAQLHRQKVIDQTELAVTTNMMQIASGLGSTDPDVRQQEISQALSGLKPLIGEEAAQQALARMEEWAKGLQLDEGAYHQRPWSIADKRTKLQQIAQGTLSTDPVIDEIKESVHKFYHSKLYLTASRTVHSALGIGCLTPTIVGTACQVVQFGIVMATGGSEEDKLLREIYLDKRLEDRSQVINEKAHMALDNYQLSVLQKNPILLSFCESMIRQMAGPDGAQAILSNAPTTDASIPQKDAKSSLNTDTKPESPTHALTEREPADSTL